MSRQSRRRFGATTGMILLMALGAACGDSGGSNTATGNPDETVEESGARVPGIPTLEELWAGDLSQPPGDSPPPAPDKTIWYISCGEPHPDCSTKSAAAEEAAAAIGWDFQLVDGNLGINNAYSNGIRSAVAAGADAIAVDAVPCTTETQALTEAKAAGVPVLGVENLDCSDTAGGGPELMTVDMGYNPEYLTRKEYWTQFGKTAADYIIAASGGTAKILNNAGNDGAQQTLMNEGFLEELKKCSGCEVVETVEFNSPDLVPNGAWISAFRSALIQHPDLTAVMVPFDSMVKTLGADRAIKESGKKVCTGSPPYDEGCILAVEAVGASDTFDSIRDGMWTASSSVRPNQWVPWAAMDSLNRFFNDELAVAEGLGFISVDAEHNLPSTPGRNYEPEIDFRSSYRDAWGVS
jgi:ribose transport system substrate-binding protein